VGSATVRREELPAAAPRALDVGEQRRLLREAERASSRDRALVVLLLYTALRLAEVVALDVDNVRISARKGVVIVRSGKGDAFREVPLNALVRQVLEEWLTDRVSRAREGERALIVGRGGRRLSKRAVDDAVRAGDRFPLHSAKIQRDWRVFHTRVVAGSKPAAPMMMMMMRKKARYGGLSAFRGEFESVAVDRGWPGLTPARARA
jgi:integrase